MYFFRSVFIHHLVKEKFLNVPIERLYHFLCLPLSPYFTFLYSFNQHWKLYYILIYAFHLSPFLENQDSYLSTASREYQQYLLYSRYLTNWVRFLYSPEVTNTKSYLPKRQWFTHKNNCKIFLSHISCTIFYCLSPYTFSALKCWV